MALGKNFNKDRNTTQIGKKQKIWKQNRRT